MLKWVFRASHCKNPPSKSNTVSFTTAIWEQQKKSEKLTNFWRFLIIRFEFLNEKLIKNVEVLINLKLLHLVGRSEHSL